MWVNRLLHKLKLDEGKYFQTNEIPLTPFFLFQKNNHCTIMYVLLSSLEYVCGQNAVSASLQVFLMRAKFLKVFRSTQVVDSSGFKWLVVALTGRLRPQVGQTAASDLVAKPK